MRFRRCASRFTERRSFVSCHSSGRPPSAASTATRIVAACASIPAYVVVIFLTGSLSYAALWPRVVTREFANLEPVTPYGLPRLHQRPSGGAAGAGGRPSPARRDRERDPRPQVRRRAQPSPLGPLRRERGVARGAGDRAQPRPLDGAPRARPGNRDDQDAQAALLRSRGAAHPFCPALDPAPPEALALGLASGQPRSRDYGRYRSRPDARSQHRPGSEARASMPAHASRTLAPAPSAPPSCAERPLLAPARPRRRPANAGTPAELSASPASRPVKLRSVDSG